MSKFGYNYDTDSVNVDFAIKAMRDSGGDAHLIMMTSPTFFFTSGNLDLVRRIAQGVPNATLILRLWNRNEGNWANYPSASEYEKNWAWVKAQLGADIMRRVVFDDCTNEPNLSGDNVAAAQAYVTRCVAMVEAAARAGVTLAIGAWSVGTPHESLLGTVYLPLWKAVSKHKQAISMHLYGAIPFEAGELVPLEHALDVEKSRQAMRDSKWPITHGGWLIARAYRVIEIFRANGLGVPSIYATEGIVDNVYNSSNAHIKEQWRSKWGIDKFNRDPRGIQTYERFVAALYPHLDFAQGVSVLFDHARRNIFWHEAFKGVCLFALNKQWGYPSGTNKEAGSNYEDPQFTVFRELYLPRINSFTIPDTPLPTEPPKPNEPPMPMIAAKIRSKAVEGTRLRQAPQNGAVLGIIHNTWISAKIQADYANTDWPKIMCWLDGNPFTGYASKAWIDIEAEAESELYTLQVGDKTLLVPRESLEDMLEFGENLLVYLRSKLDE